MFWALSNALNALLSPWALGITLLKSVLLFKRVLIVVVYLDMVSTSLKVVFMPLTLTLLRLLTVAASLTSWLATLLPLELGVPLEAVCFGSSLGGVVEAGVFFWSCKSVSKVCWSWVSLFSALCKLLKAVYSAVWSFVKVVSSKSLVLASALTWFTAFSKAFSAVWTAELSVSTCLAALATVVSVLFV